MSDSITVTTLVLAAIPTTIASVVAAIVAIRGKEIAIKTHDMVNGQMLIQLQLNATTARAFANFKPEPAIISAAELAEKMLDQHKSKLLNMEPSKAG